jgi:hypothetical protein
MPTLHVLCLNIILDIDMRRRFSLNAVASSDGVHTRVSHDRRANTTGRRVKQAFVKCGGIKIAVTAMQAAMLAPCQKVFVL